MSDWVEMVNLQLVDFEERLRTLEERSCGLGSAYEALEMQLVQAEHVLRQAPIDAMLSLLSVEDQETIEAEQITAWIALWREVTGNSPAGVPEDNGDCRRD